MATHPSDDSLFRAIGQLLTQVSGTNTDAHHARVFNFDVLAVAATGDLGFAGLLCEDIATLPA